MGLSDLWQRFTNLLHYYYDNDVTTLIQSNNPTCLLQVVNSLFQKLGTSSAKTSREQLMNLSTCYNFFASLKQPICFTYLEGGGEVRMVSSNRPHSGDERMPTNDVSTPHERYTTVSRHL